MAQTIYHDKTSLTGGSATALDGIDGNSLVDGDRAYVLIPGTLTFYVYRLNATSGAAESSPNIIAPDTNAGTKRWILFSIMASTTVEISTTRADNDSSTYIATTAFAKSQDAVLAREPNQGVALSAGAVAAIKTTHSAVFSNTTNSFGIGIDAILPTWTPAATQVLMCKWAANVGYKLECLITSGAFRLTLNATTYDSAVPGGGAASNLVAGTRHKIIAVPTVGASTTTVSFYLDGVLLSTVAAQANVDVTNTQDMYTGGTSAVTYTMTVFDSYAMNFAPTAAEVLDMYRNGIPEWAKWGSQTSLITGDNSTFASDTGWWDRVGVTITGGEAVFNNGVIYKNNFLTATKRYRVEVNITEASSNGWNIYLSGGYVSTGWTGTGLKSYEYTPDDANLNIAINNNGAANGKITSFTLVPIGLTAAYLPENIQPDKWYDASSNALHASYPTSGWSLTRPTVLRASSLPALTSFAGTVSVSGTTVTFSSASDCALCNVGSTIVAGGDTRYITKLINSTTLVIDQTASWSSTAITSIQNPQFVTGSNGTTRTFVAANGSVTTILVSDGTILEHQTVDGKRGIGKVPTYQLELSLDSAGKPGVGGLWTVVSDERIKKDIIPADLNRCYEIIKSIPLRRFAWADGVYTEEQVKDRHNLGWIAQDVEKVFAKAVNLKPFTKAEQIPDGFEEYEEQDFIIEEVEKEEISIEVKDGKAVQVKKIVKAENKVLLFDTLEVFDEDGNLVKDTEGIPLTHQVPIMVKKTREKFRREIIEDCLDLNPGQLIAAMYGCIQFLQAKVEVLEKRSNYSSKQKT